MKNVLNVIGSLFLALMLFVALGCEDTKVYTVTFMDDDVIETQKVKEGEKTSAISAPEKENKTFECWTLDGEEFSFETAITKDITLKAKWKESDMIFTVTVKDGEEVINTYEVDSGKKLDELASLNKDGYVFLYYALNGEEFDFNTVINNNITLEAVWREAKTFTVSFYDGDKLLKEIKVLEDNPIDSFIPEKEGFVFDCWLCDGKNFDELVTSDLVLSAKWNVKPYIIEFYDEDELIKTIEVIPGEPLEEPTYEKNGYLFLGWDTDLSDIAGDMKVYAELVALNYDITYHNSNRNGNPTSYNIEDCPIKLYDAEKEGYIFDGWYDSETGGNKITVIAVGTYGNLDLYARFYKKVEVSFKLEGGYFSSKTIEDYDLAEASETGNYKATLYETLELPVPFKYGYNFKGWSANGNIIDTVSSEISILSAVWEMRSNIPEDQMLSFEEEMTEKLYKTITSDITLPETIENTNITVSWSSSDESLITAGGKVTRQYGEDKKCTLKAVMKAGDVVKEFSITVTVARGYKDISEGGIIAGYNYTSNTPSDETLQKVDILYCAFGSAGANGHISNYINIGAYIKSYMDKAHSYGDYVILSINTSNLDVVCRKAELINVFVNDCVSIINEYGFDGIDIDWERPAVNEKQNYTALMKALYTKVKANNPEHLVTTATAAGPWQYPSFDLENSIQYIDYINLMAYDLQTNSKSTHHSALYPSTKGYTVGGCSIDETIPLYNKLGVPNSKIIVGLPFYGRQFIETDGIGKSSSTGGSATQTFIYQTYLNNPNAQGVTIVFDDECKVPYIYDSNNRLFISYDNEKSIGYKCEYVKEKGLAGMMYWQDSQDYQHILLNALYSNKKIMK